MHPYSSQTEHVNLHDQIFLPLFSEKQIRDRTSEIGLALHGQYGGKTPVFISILSGAFVFAADLIRHFPDACEVNFVKLSSYRGEQSTGEVQTIMGLTHDLTGRHLIVVEDIVDTGRTLHYFLGQLQQQNPASICAVSLLRKPDAAQFDVPIDHVGFEISDRFVVGYGLDYDGLGRNLPGVFVKAGV